MRSHVFAASGIILATALAVANEPTLDRSPERIARLIGQLGSPQFKERETAMRELDLIGDAALDALRKAAKASDMETLRRAGELVRRIQQRAAAARLLSASEIELNYENATVREIVKDLNKRTGLLFGFHGDPSRTVSRRVNEKAESPEPPSAQGESELDKFDVRRSAPAVP